MNQSILEKALNQITLRRHAAENEAINHKIEALKDKEFYALYQNYTAKMIEEAKTGQFSSVLTGLKYEMENRLKQLGIGSIEAIYHCHLCHDTGYMDGKQCECLKRELNEILVHESGFGRLEKFEDADYSVFEHPEYMQQIYAKMQKWCASDFSKNIIYLSGGTGTGKTFLLKCIASELIRYGKVITLVTAFKMNQDFLKSHTSKDQEEKQQLLERYISSEVLFIDDLGTEINTKGITNNYLYLVLNERKMKNLPTIITSNLDLSELRDYYDERISSRIADTTSIRLQLENADLRLKKQQK